MDYFSNLGDFVAVGFYWTRRWQFDPSLVGGCGDRADHQPADGT